MEHRFRTRYIDWRVFRNKNLSKDCEEFVKALLQDSPKSRMSCADALQHPWLLPLTKEFGDGETAGRDQARSVPNLDSSFLSTSSREAAAGSFVSEVSFASMSTPRAGHYAVAGMSGEFEQITMEDKDVDAEMKALQETISRKGSQKLRRHHMEVAEVDSAGRLTEFRDMDAASLPPNSPILDSPAVENPPGPTEEAPPTSTGSRKRKERSQSLSQEKIGDKDGDDGSTSDSSLLTPLSDASEDPAPVKGPTLRNTNARKKAAPQIIERKGRAPAKRTRASERQRGDDAEV